jgi:ABC-type lipoprotein export system ATPase subunit
MKRLVAHQLKKSYRAGDRGIEILKGVSFSIEAEESVAIMGPSGSGKSTLLQVLGTMYRPDSGQLMIGERDVLAIDDDEISRFRRRELGFVFQKFNLLRALTAKENAAWPLLIDGRGKKESYSRALALLDKVGLASRADHYPSQLSGGEQQRVAIARALIASPKIVFADEPTGALDSVTGVVVLKLLKETVRSEKGSLIIVTHDASAAASCDRTIHIKDGVPC